MDCFIGKEFVANNGDVGTFVGKNKNRWTLSFANGTTNDFFGSNVRKGSFSMPEVVVEKDGVCYVSSTANKFVLLDTEFKYIIPDCGRFTVDVARGYHRVRLRKAPNRGKNLSRFIAEEVLGKILPHNILLDHINRDPLDNRLENLRLATTRMNNNNRPLPTLVRKSRRGGGWVAQIGFDDINGNSYKVCLPSIKDKGLVEQAAAYLVGKLRIPVSEHREGYEKYREDFIKLFDVAAEESKNRRWQDKAKSMTDWLEFNSEIFKKAEEAIAASVKEIEVFSGFSFNTNLSEIRNGD